VRRAINYCEGWVSMAPTLRACVRRAGTKKQIKQMEKMSDAEIENRAVMGALIKKENG